VSRWAFVRQVRSYSYDQPMTSPGGQTSYTYDAANRLTSVGGVAYTWDANGNLTSDGVRSYTYDHSNRLTQVTQGSFTTQYVYNGDGVRTSKTVAGDTTEYALDLLATLPVVISDTDAVYLYGLDIIAQQQAERQYYMHDGLGSVRQLVDTTGQIETNYAYDPFGVPVVEGDESNPYQYTGEAWDEEVGLLYLRARYYQPEVGRFITKDPWAGSISQPLTLNRYVYVMGNAPNRADPMGLRTGDPPEAFGDAPAGYQLRDPYASYSGYTLLREAGVMAQGLYGTSWGPFALSTEMTDYLRTGYSRSASLGQAESILVAWFLQLGPQKQYFGPEYSLTQDVSRSDAVKYFRQQWSADAEGLGRYRLPYSQPARSIDERDGTLRSQLAAWGTYARKNAALGLCVLGLGSRVAEGGIDPIVAVFGSFSDITVWPVGVSDRVVFVVHNVMGKASLTRLPGTTSHRWENEARSETSWGGTIHQYFYWYERDPNIV